MDDRLRTGDPTGDPTENTRFGTMGLENNGVRLTQRAQKMNQLTQGSEVAERTQLSLQACNGSTLKAGNRMSCLVQVAPGPISEHDAESLPW
jgi:hypothetical protein